MRLPCKPLASLGIAVFFIVSVSTSVFAQEQVRIGGTGGALAAMKKLGEAFQRTHPGIMVTVLPSLGSSGGIKAVLADALDIGVSSRPLNDKEQTAVSRELTQTPFVFAVPKTNPVRGLTLQEVEAIYSGVTRTWPRGKQVRVILRPATEYDTSVLKSMSPVMNRAVTEGLSREGMIIAITDQDNAEAISKVPGALGTTTLGQILCEGLPLKALTFDGVKPGTDTISRHAYPYAKTYYVVMKRDLRLPVRQFIDFIFSARGRSILSKCGYYIAP